MVFYCFIQNGQVIFELYNISFDMQYRHLGPTGIKVSVISYGNWLNSNTQEAKELTIKCVKQAWDLGINFFDTAQVYGFGQAERQIGVALRALNVPRHQFVLSTKLYWGQKQKIVNTRGLSRKHIIEGIKKSLKNLQYDYVDVLFCHRPDTETPMQETCRAFDWIIRKGLAFYWGTSQWNAQEIAEAHYVCEKYSLIKPVVQQPQYNIFTREKMEIGFQRLFEQNRLGTTIWSPLAGGVLAGKYNDGIPEGSRFQKNSDMIGLFNKYFSEQAKGKTIDSLTKFKKIADSLGCSQAQLAMAWCISNPDVSTAITGASRPEQLVETVKAVQILSKLTAQVQLQIEEAFKITLVGRRSFKDLSSSKGRRRQILKY